MLSELVQQPFIGSFAVLLLSVCFVPTLTGASA
jgi:hypothetical protein